MKEINLIQFLIYFFHFFSMNSGVKGGIGVFDFDFDSDFDSDLFEDLEIDLDLILSFLILSFCNSTNLTVRQDLQLNFACSTSSFRLLSP